MRPSSASNSSAGLGEDGEGKRTGEEARRAHQPNPLLMSAGNSTELFCLNSGHIVVNTYWSSSLNTLHPLAAFLHGSVLGLFGSTIDVQDMCRLTQTARIFTASRPGRLARLSRRYRDFLVLLWQSSPPTILHATMQGPIVGFKNPEQVFPEPATRQDNR